MTDVEECLLRGILEQLVELQGNLGGEAASSFINLTDTPSAYTGANGYAVRVNSGASGLEFTDSLSLVDLVVGAGGGDHGIGIKNGDNFTGTLFSGSLTADRSFQLPDEAGTLMLATGGSTISPTFKSITLTGGTITADNPILNATRTWNNAGVTFTALKLDVTDSASASGSLLADLRVGGVSKFKLYKTGFLVNASGFFGQTETTYLHVSSALQAFNSGVSYFVAGTSWWGLNSSQLLGWGATPSSSIDLALGRAAADTLALRRGANAQAFQVFNTYTNDSNYERAKFAWESNVLKFGTEKAGTGTARALELQTDGTARATFGAAGTLTLATPLVQAPSASVTLGTNGQLAFEATDNSTITVKFRGSDGTTRSATIALT